ncbi:MAG: hypothetical protein JXM79_00830 [Sedimentisphaerales bacterium]|nr:hypothetical protein [Sedimentisphaerales bacterium]
MVVLKTILSYSGLHRQCVKSSIPWVVLLAVCLFGRMAEAHYGGGTGTPDDPYLIYTAEQLNEIGVDSQNLNKHFKLMADIDLSGYTGTDFNIIGTSYTKRFSGVFDGNRSKIHNFTYISGDRDYVGLFGSVGGENALIKNLGLINAIVDAGTGQYVGLLAGNLREGTIRGCYARGGSVSGRDDVGGLVGRSLQSTITDSYAIVSVSGRSDVGGLVGTNQNHVSPLRPVSTNMISNCCATGNILARINAGGLVGHNWDGTIANCYSTGSVSNEFGWCLGGLVGRIFGGTVTDCYSTGKVSGYLEIGGLIGGNREGIITHCYSTGGVTGTQQVGGLMGSNSKGSVGACFWDRQKSGLSNMCGEQDESGTGCDDGCAKITTQMQTASTFLEAGWDFVRENVNGTEDIWNICEGLNYPQFTWQFVAGDFNGDFRMDFTDFALFAERWMSSDGGFLWCRGADLTGDGEVGFDDLKAFADRWLTDGIPISTAGVCLIIDDFESYNDLDPDDPESNRIFDVWVDGYNNLLENGCTVGHFFPPYAERDIVYAGEQSMPYYYNALFKVAKAERTLNPAQNWAETGAEVLSLWFHGDSMNGVTPMSVVLNGCAVYHDHPEATRINAWTEWIIDLKYFVGVDLAHVRSIAICLGDPSKLQAGGTGLMFFDSIQLYGPG